MRHIKRPSSAFNIGSGNRSLRFTATGRVSVSSPLTGVAMSNTFTENTLTQALEWAYEKAMDGIPGTGNAQEFADEYRNNNANALDAANSLIRWQNTKAATSGFLTGLGGI